MDSFQFDRRSLSKTRPPGISAIMRIKNGADFLQLSIESHLPYVDEVVACYNDCTDDTEIILQKLAQKYPNRVRPIKYIPYVHPILSLEHAQTPTESIHSIANYYNFALSQARYSYATKLDDDHLAIDIHLQPAIDLIRKTINKGKKELFTFSGVNLIINAEGEIGVYTKEPLVGSGDHLYFPVCEEIYFIQNQRTEIFNFAPPKLPKQYIGLLYFHLKHCKTTLGLHNLNEQARIAYQTQLNQTDSWMSYEEFKAPQNIKKMKRKIHPLEYWIRTTPLIQHTIYQITKRNPPLNICRMARMDSDLAAINFEIDVIKKLTA